MRPPLKTPSSPSQISFATTDAVEILRRQRRTQEHIADELAISKASVLRKASVKDAVAQAMAMKTVKSTIVRLEERL